MGGSLAFRHTISSMPKAISMEHFDFQLDGMSGPEIVHEMVKFFHENGTYVVLLADADPQAYRTDRF